MSPRVYSAIFGILARERGRCLSILNFHRVLPDYDPMRPSVLQRDAFAAQMRWVRRYFNPISLSDAIDLLKRGAQLPPRALAVTFDDGYADNFEVAAPILEELRIPATVFVATGHLDGGCMWNDTVIEAIRNCSDRFLDLSDLGLGVLPVESFESKRKAAAVVLTTIKHRETDERATLVDMIAGQATALPEDLMLTTRQLRALRDVGVDIGAHTVTHPILARLDTHASSWEVSESKAQLERILDEKVSLFAYPNGKRGQDWTDEHAAMVAEAGYLAAVTTDPGVSDATTDLFNMPRFTPWDRSELRYLMRMLRNSRQST